MQEYPNIIADYKDWPITQFYSDRERVVKKLANSTMEYLMEHHEGELLSLLNQTIYAEKLRTKTEPLKVDPPKENNYWKKMEVDLATELLSGAESMKAVEERLRKIVNRYSEEITGDFQPKTFQFARKALTRFFSALYNPFFVKGGGPMWGSKETLLDKFRIEGPMDHIRELFDKGTVLILPTHFSNLDSILIGYAIEMLTGMPAYSYGAGLNLYDYELMAYYMSRLGAYKVDRRKKNPIYAQCIRQFSTISIQEGMNSIFFPGGTRSRNGQIEQKVKLGLLSTLIDAQNEFYLRNFDKKIIIVPLVISYHFVLEAGSLIEQHLKRVGKENYLAQRKPKKTYMKNIRFLNRLMKSDSSVTLSFGEPIDIFGNPLDRDANSIKNDKPIDIKGYFLSDGKMTFDKQRNMVYTRHLGGEIVKSFYKENIVLSSHLVAYVGFQMFKKKYANIDLFNLLNLPKDYLDFELHHFLETLDYLRDKLIEREQAGEIKLSDEVRSYNAKSLIEDAIKNLNVYHFYKPIGIKSGKVYSEDYRLLYYYHNRLEGYDLDKHVKVAAMKSFKLSPIAY